MGTVLVDPALGTLFWMKQFEELMKKNSVNDLAIFKGDPLFSEQLHVGRPNIGNRRNFEGRVGDILDRKWLTNGGKYVQEFERQVEKMMDVKHCIAICNATVALEIAIRALGMTGEVIVPSFTFVATAHALQWQEITPVFCDIDPHTHNLDPQQVERMITPRTTGIIGVHVWGRACNIEALKDIAQRRNLRLLFDAAHAFACTYKGRMIGGFGDAEIFSFHATKFFNTLEGGAITTNNDELAHKMRMMKNFGFTTYDRTDYVGINGKMNEISAAMGVTNLESLDEFIAINRQNYEFYRTYLAGLEGVSLIDYDGTERYNYQYIVLEIDSQKTRLTRDELVAILHAEKILARRYFYPGCHQMEPYRSYFPHSGLLLAQTERLTQRVLCLPNGTAVSEGEIRKICELIRFALGNSEEIKRTLLEEKL
jgi:dTDP-4-amino-4,6-dideoxygalactose transaminase